MMQGGLSVGDGFKFGCGFMLAGIIAWIAIAIIALAGAVQARTQNTAEAKDSCTTYIYWESPLLK
ncbi:MAG: hypothetical protein NZ765_09365 [Anaerolineae bacterium]|nr:hypothetical protein [Anaerolineae bacterium]